MKTGLEGSRASSGMIWKAVEAWIGTVRERVEGSGRAAPWMSWLRKGVGAEGGRSAGNPVLAADHCPLVDRKCIKL